GCAPSLAAPRAAIRTAEAPRRAAEEASRAERERVGELEAALGLAHAEVRALRAELAEREAAERMRVTRICGTAAAQSASEVEPEPDPAPARAGSRPVLRLYGSPTPAVQAIPGPAAP